MSLLEAIQQLASIYSDEALPVNRTAEIVVEMPDDKSRYAVNGIRVENNETLIIEIG